MFIIIMKNLQDKSDSATKAKSKFSLLAIKQSGRATKNVMPSSALKCSHKRKMVFDLQIKVTSLMYFHIHFGC